MDLVPPTDPWHLAHGNGHIHFLRLIGKREIDPEQAPGAGAGDSAGGPREAPESMWSGSRLD